MAVAREELERGTPPDRVGFLSFTRQAAHEATERAGSELGLGRDQLPYFRTIHSLCFRELGLGRGDVMTSRLTREFGDWAGIEVSGKVSEDGSEEGYLLGDRALFIDNLARVRGLPLRKQYDTGPIENMPWRELDRVSRSLIEFKKTRGILDFTDILSEFIREGISPRLDVLLIDEAQDLSHLQWEVVRLVSRGCRRRVVAGDDDQAIFPWAGADARAFIELAGASRVLAQSYRVPRSVQRVAKGLLDMIHERREKVWQPRPDEGVVERASSFDDTDTDGADVLILGRNSKYLTTRVEPVLRRRGVVYERNGKPSVEPHVMAAIEVWERLRAGGTAAPDEVKMAYRYITGGRGVERGAKGLSGFGPDDQLTIAVLKKAGGLLTDAIWHEALDRLPADEMSYILAARRRGEKFRAQPRVRVSTIHRAKGSQAKHVILLSDMANRTRREMYDDVDSEIRVWYVGVTRAMDKLTVVSAEAGEACPWV
jgi:UvrD/REP helicase N-terminal domain/UvrD-like helicase C-terminal domain